MNRAKLEQRRARRRDKLDRLDKIKLYHEKILMHRAQVETEEKLPDPNLEKLRQLKQRIRTLEQQIRYMAP